MRKALLYLAAVGFVVAGVMHFVKPRVYERIIPPGFPAPALLVAVSGVAEIAGGLGLLVRRLRCWAGVGLIALLVAVFPANLYWAMHPDIVEGVRVSRWLLYARLPLQAVMIAWVWWVMRD